MPRSVRLLLRVGWAFVGFVLSLPAFLPPLIGVIMVVAIGGLTGDSMPQLFHTILWLPQRAALFWVVVFYAAYWISVGVIVVQFVFGKELWLLPLAIVSIGMVSALVALQPWHASHEPFTMGPLALLHVAFMLTVFWASAGCPLHFGRRDVRRA